MGAERRTFLSTMSLLFPISILFTDSVACCSMFLIQLRISVHTTKANHPPPR
jgi:hypothetical protein